LIGVFLFFKNKINVKLAFHRQGLKFGLTLVPLLRSFHLFFCTQKIYELKLIFISNAIAKNEILFANLNKNKFILMK
jgi:hypothetical protein